MQENKNVRHHFLLPLLKRQLKKPGIYVIAMLCLLFLYIFDQVVFPSASQLKYGVVVKDSANGERLLEVLEAQDEIYEVIECPDRETLCQQVAAGKLDCGFLVDERLDQVKDLGHMEGIADYICSTATKKGLLLQEKVFAGMLQIISYNLLDTMSKDGSVYAEASPELTEELLQYYDYYLEGNNTLQLYVEDVQVPDSTANKVMEEWRLSSKVPDATRLGMCGILIFTCALIFARNRFSHESKKILNALRGEERVRWRLLEILIPVTILSAVIAFAYLLLQNVVDAKEVLSSGLTLRSVATLLIFGVVCALWAAAYSCLFPREEIYLFTVPVIVMVGIVMCPAIIKLGGILPVVDVFKWIFPVSYL